MGKYLVVVNPVSGRGRGMRRLSMIQRMLGGAGHEVFVEPTCHAGHARELARAYHDKVNGILSVGGDGTCHEVLNGLPPGSITPFGMVPLGTGNAIAKEFGYKDDPRAVLEAVLSNSVARLDCGEMDSSRSRFLMMLSAGFDALAVQRLEEQRSGPIHMLDYVPLVLRELQRLPHYAIRVIADGEDKGVFSYVNCANFRSYGGPVEFASHAKPDDGVFDVIATKLNIRRAFPRLIAGAFFRQFERLPGVQRFQAKHIRMEPADGSEIPMQADGEYRGMLPVEALVAPRSVSMFAPRDYLT
ncbi:MAG: diacylglycerol kinase family lipid kinase [Planctomycetes bacterium]|nr:diacylglycerol kinase family lipid kinase [Planctomycetota bacterium]NUQ33814.1 diacylglycerol kinase family lipid kinase [Planctomycetaceae bacterium]